METPLENWRGQYLHVPFFADLRHPTVREKDMKKALSRMRAFKTLAKYRDDYSVFRERRFNGGQV